MEGTEGFSAAKGGRTGMDAKGIRWLSDVPCPRASCSAGLEEERKNTRDPN